MKPLTEKEMKSLPPGKWYKIKGTKTFDPSLGRYVEKTERGVYVPKPKPKMYGNLPASVIDRINVDNRRVSSFSGGHDPGKAGPVARRKSSFVDQQAALALSAVHGFLSRVDHLLAGIGRRIRSVVVDSVRHLFGRD